MYQDKLNFSNCFSIFVFTTQEKVMVMRSQNQKREISLATTIISCFEIFCFLNWDSKFFAHFKQNSIL